ncbi:MAG: HIT family protein [Planctomycetota bacterium]|jgi:ATP adenylyltransferase
MAGKKKTPRQAPAGAAQVRDALLGGLIWAPWRMQYVRGLDGKKGAKRCPFCPMTATPAAKRPSDRDLLVLYRGRHAFLVLNLFPYTPGHLLSVPKRHVGDLQQLRPGERQEIWELALLGQQLLTDASNPPGFNVGMNLGRAGGAAVVDHVHMHVVPRWDGDSNFVPVIGGTRVSPEGLPETWDRLRPLFDAAKKRRAKRRR